MTVGPGYRAGVNAYPLPYATGFHRRQHNMPRVLRQILRALVWPVWFIAFRSEQDLDACVTQFFDATTERWMSRLSGIEKRQGRKG
ncbi:MAG: hypothetical protein ACRDRE_16660, partial [Pseudonocardiaceae bacterium]